MNAEDDNGFADLPEGSVDGKHARIDPGLLRRDELILFSGLAELTDPIPTSRSGLLGAIDWHARIADTDLRYVRDVPSRRPIVLTAATLVMAGLIVWSTVNAENLFGRNHALVASSQAQKTYAVDLSGHGGFELNELNISDLEGIRVHEAGEEYAFAGAARLTGPLEIVLGLVMIAGGVVMLLIGGIYTWDLVTYFRYRTIRAHYERHGGS